MSDVDRAELWRLLEEAELPWTIEQATPNMDGPNWRLRREGKAGIVVSAHEYGFHGRGELIAAAVNALPGLLDALEKAEAHRDSLAATLIEVQREKRLLVDQVRELHTPEDEWCNYHESARCGCIDAYCEECGDSYPCPTIQAFDGSADPKPVDPVLDENDKRDRIDCGGDKWHWSGDDEAWRCGYYSARGNLAAIDRHYGPLNFADKETEA